MDPTKFNLKDIIFLIVQLLMLFCLLFIFWGGDRRFERLVQLEEKIGKVEDAVHASRTQTVKKLDQIKGKLGSGIRIGPTDGGGDGDNVDAETAEYLALEDKYNYPVEWPTNDWYYLNIGQDEETLNPITATSSNSTIIQNYIYEGLFSQDSETFEWYPNLAEWYEVSEDKLLYTFRIREDAHWGDSNMTPVTAHDVKFTYNVIMHDSVDNAHAKLYYQDINKCEVIDDRNVQFTYSKKYWLGFNFVAGMTLISKSIYLKEVAERAEEEGLEIDWDEDEGFPSKYKIQEGDSDAVRAQKAQDASPYTNWGSVFNKIREPLGGAGPYVLDDWKTGISISLKKRPIYWNDGRRYSGHFEGVKFIMINDPTAASNAFKDGKFDVFGVRPVDWEREDKDHPYFKSCTFRSRVACSYGYLGYNSRLPFFSNSRLRNAMSMLMNRDELLKSYFKGKWAKKITGPFWINGFVYNPDVPEVPFDPEGAKEIFEEEGWVDTNNDGVRDKDGTPFKFSLLITQGPYQEMVGSHVKTECKKVGIEVSIETVEWSVFTKKLKEKSIEVVMLGWSISAEGDPYQLWHSSQADVPGSSNYIGYKNEEVDKLIVECRVEFDEDIRRDKLRKVFRLIAEDHPYTFMFSSISIALYHPRFENVHLYKKIRYLTRPLEWWVKPENVLRGK